MKIKDYIVPFLFAFATAWFLQRFVVNRWFASDTGSTERSAVFNAPEYSQEARPLNTEIDFADDEKKESATITEVDTPWGILTFSTHGASLERVVLKRTIDGDKQFLTTLMPPGEHEKEQRCFLVAFQEQTPFYYKLVNETDAGNKTLITYQATSHIGTIRKTFVVYKNIHQIDMNIMVTPSVDSVVTRLFFSAPHLEGVLHDTISGIAISESGVFSKTSRTSLPINQGWWKPTLFGCDSKYIIYALIHDDNNFMQRAYYKHADERLFSIVEAQEIKTAQEWQISFYFGPKESDAVAAVDDRLEQTFEYSGYLAPISRVLLKILNYLYNYVGNYGFAIILLTLLIKLLLLPFSIKSEGGTKQRADMQKKLQYLQQKYKNDPATLAREREELIRKHGMPGLGSCLPLLIQIPVFFALSRILGNSIELYHAPMLWIPDLSGTDPYYILPMAVTGAMLAQAATADSQQRMSVIAMALVFGAVTASFSAGLALYICTNTVLSVLQTSALKWLKIVK